MVERGQIPRCLHPHVLSITSPRASLPRFLRSELRQARALQFDQGEEGSCGG